MKLKVIKRECKEVETDLDLPVYLYFQDEFCNDELVKITEKEKITIKYNNDGFVISVEANFYIDDLNFSRHQTTEKHFNETYFEALKNLSYSVFNEQKNIMLRYKCATCGNQCLEQYRPDNSTCGGCENPNWKLMKIQEPYMVGQKEYVHPLGEI